MTLYTANSGYINIGNTSTTGNFVVNYTSTFVGNVTSNIFTANYLYGNGSNLSGISGSNVTGQVANALVAGTVYTNAQPNITSTGTLTSLTVSGNANISNLQLNTFQETVYTYGNASGTITPDFNNGSIQKLTLTGNITMNTLGNAIAGRSMTLILTQDATGGRALTSSMKYADGFNSLSVTANSTDIISVFYDGSVYYASLTTGYV
jgi:hypothetical protein